MSETKQTPDLSKIVGLIMENPKLIEEISALVKKSEDEKGEDEKGELEEPPKATPTVAAESDSSRSQRRERLLCALKPYVSKERARAIDSMISIAEMLEVMRAR